jgi:hypothetical protein
MILGPKMQKKTEKTPDNSFLEKKKIIFPTEFPQALTLENLSQQELDKIAKALDSLGETFTDLVDEK